MNLEEIDKAVEFLKDGGVIIYPTETVYGLGCDIFSEGAVQKIYELKGREFDKPLSILLKKEWINEYVEVPELAKDYVDKLPAPLTLVLPKKEIVPSWISPTGFVGVRISESSIVEELLSRFGKPITTTSANEAGESSPTKVEDISKQIKEKVDYILDTGETEHGKVSTIIKIDKKVEVLREGAFKIEA